MHAALSLVFPAIAAVLARPVRAGVVGLRDPTASALLPHQIIHHLDANGHLAWDLVPGGRATFVSDQLHQMAYTNLTSAGSDTRRWTVPDLHQFFNFDQKEPDTEKLTTVGACIQGGSTIIVDMLKDPITNACQQFTAQSSAGKLVNTGYLVYQTAMDFTDTQSRGAANAYYLARLNNDSGGTGTPPTYTESLCTAAFDYMVGKLCVRGDGSTAGAAIEYGQSANNVGSGSLMFVLNPDGPSDHDL